MKFVGVIGLIFALVACGLLVVAGFSLQPSGLSVGGPVGQFFGQTPLLFLILLVALAVMVIVGVGTAIWKAIS